MAEETAQLRQEIEQRRQNISQTVDQIENRVNPMKAARRSTSRIRRGMTDLKDRIMGNDQPHYSTYGNRGYGDDAQESTMERVKHAVEDVHPTEYVRRQTRGNPLAAGLISLGTGALIGSLLSETDRERRMASNIQPQVEDVTREAAAMGREVAEDVKESAGQEASALRDKANQAASEVGEEAKTAVEDLRAGGEDSPPAESSEKGEQQRQSGTAAGPEST